MTRKDYELVAETLNRQKPAELSSNGAAKAQHVGDVTALAAVFLDTYPNFNRTKFLNAAFG